ncbi:dna replication licensing factor mcm2 [Trichoderma arundinaceum]|uniref:Dna replication licensing factor mcm2 n=1 Tax=Trichoderma arundinaceum TaxID=490622 RepID=A0A395NEF7_TRIAR|nr:dna replication licensing factor mcm2 [Trichoderma arundinaceum]
MSSPLRDYPASANRGSAPRSGRKRPRSDGDDVSTPGALSSSPLPSSPPDPFNIAHGVDEDEDIEEEAEIHDSIDDIDEMADDDVDLFREGFEADYRDRVEDFLKGRSSLEALRDVKASNLTEWVSQPPVQRTIKREFKAFLTPYIDASVSSVFKLFDEVAMDVVLLHYPEYERIHSEIHVRIFDLPVHYTLRQLRYVLPELSVSRAVHPELREDRLRNYQRLTLQESPGTVPAGRLPRHREVIVLWDLIDKAKPGEEIELTGIYRNNYDAQLNNRNGFPIFATILEANNVVMAHDQLVGFRLTEEDEQEIHVLARDPKIVDRTAAVALSLFGGVAKTGRGAHRVHGDINVLFLGDPKTAKSQVLKYVEKTAHRAGQGASAVGQTASVRRNPLTSEWTLEVVLSSWRTGAHA